MVSHISIDDPHSHELTVTLKQRPELVKKYSRPSLRKSVIQVANTFIPFVLLWWLAYTVLPVSMVGAVLVCIVNAFFLWRMLIIQHDCSHLSFFPSKMANAWMGNICSAFTLIPFKYRQAIHNTHHRHNGVLDENVRDIGAVKTMNADEYARATPLRQLIYRMSRHWISLFVIGPFYYFLVAQRIPIRIFPHGTSIILQQMLTTAVIAVIIYALGTTLGWFAFLFVHGVTFFVFGVLTIWMFYVQHQHEHAYREYKQDREYLLASLQWSSFYDLPFVLHWATWYIGYHHIHHLCAAIPNYNLKQCHEEHPVLSSVTERLSLRKSFSLIHNFLWDEQDKRMITFKEYKRKYNQNQ